MPLHTSELHSTAFDPSFFVQPHWVFIIDPTTGQIVQHSPGQFLNFPHLRCSHVSELLDQVYDADLEGATQLLYGRQDSAGFRLKTQTGAWLWLHGRAFALTDPQQAHHQMAVVLRQVQENISASPHNRLVEQALLEQVQRAEAVAHFIGRMNAGVTLEQVIDNACTEIVQALDVPYAIIQLLDPRQDMLVVAHYHTSNPNDTGLNSYQPIPRASFDALRQQMGEIILIPDAQQLPGMVTDEVLTFIDVRTLVIASLEQDGELLGVLTLACLDTPRDFSKQELALVKIYAEQVTQAIARTRLLGLAQRQARRLELLNTIASTALESSSLKVMLDSLTHFFSEKLCAQGCIILLWDDEQRAMLPFSGYGTGAKIFLNMSYGLTDLDWSIQMMEAGHTSYVDKVDGYISDDLRQQMPAGFELPSAALAMPLRVKERGLGVLFAGFGRPNPVFSEDELSGWEEVAAQLSLAIEKLKLLDQEQRRRSEAEQLRHATAALAGQLDLHQVLENILTFLAQVVPMHGATITMLEGDALRIMAARGTSEQYMKRNRLIAPGFGLFKLLEQAENPVIVDDLPSHPATPADSYLPVSFGSWIGTPLVAFGNRIGYLTLGHQQKHAYSASDARNVQAFAQQAAIAIDNARMFEQVRQGREQLKQLSRRMVEVQEEERRTLARELHDEIGQVLTGLMYTLEMSHRLEGEALHQTLAEAQANMSTLMRQIRELSLNLRPSILDDLGLQAALQWLFSRFHEQTGIQVHFYPTNLPLELDSNIAITAFRVVQEALTNTARHAKVKEVSIWASRAEDELLIQVEDHGIGFDPSQVYLHYQTSGITGMNERVNLVGGRFEILAEPGQGTQINVSLPLGK